MISLKVHNIIDYVGALFLILAPFLFGFVDVDGARNAFMISGLVLLLYSLFTSYQYSLVGVIPLGLHMTLDVLVGVFLVTSPWIFNYRGQMSPAQEILHYVMGIGLFLAVGLARAKNESAKRAHGVLAMGASR